MNWIILLLAGLFEVSLTFCLERLSGFHRIEHDFACQSGANVAFGDCIRHLDGHRGGRHGLDWYIRIQGACHSHPAFLPVHAYRFLDRVENRVILRKEAEDEV